MSSGNNVNARAEESCMLRIGLLGGFRVWVGPHLIPEETWKRRKVQALVKLLALDARHRLHREQLMELLWPKAGLEAARNSLRQTLHLARRIMGNEPNSGSRYLADDNAWLSLAPEGQIWVDVEAFEAAAAAARRSTDPAAYQAALALYTGELLPEDRYEDWAAPRRESLRLLHLDLLSELGRLLETREEIEQATGVFRQVVAVDPTVEEAHPALMRLYAAAGQRHQALQQYRRLQAILRQELEVEPDPVSQGLYAEILSGRFQQPGTPGRSPAQSAAGPGQVRIQRNGSNHHRTDKSLNVQLQLP